MNSILKMELYFMAWQSRTSVVLPFAYQAYVGDFTEFRNNYIVHFHKPF